MEASNICGDDEVVQSSCVNASECDGDVYRESVVVPDWVGNCESIDNEGPWCDVASPNNDVEPIKSESKINEEVGDIVDDCIVPVIEGFPSPTVNGPISALNVKEVSVGSINPFDDEVDSITGENSQIVVAVVEPVANGSDNPFDDNYVEPVSNTVSVPSVNPFDENYNEAYANAFVANHTPKQSHNTPQRSITTPARNNLNTTKYQQDVNTLVGYGFDSQKVASAYQHCGYNISKTFQLLNNKVTEISLTDNRDTHCWWRTPFSARILSWMPGLSNETVFHITITHHTENKIWSIEKSCAEFDQLNSALKVPGYKAFPKGMEFPYPEASYSSVFFGVSEKERIDRMVKLNQWFKEIILNPLMMLQSNVRLLVHDFISMDNHIGNK